MLSPQEREAKSKERWRRYRQSAKGKAAKKRYQQAHREIYRESQRKYEQTLKGQAVRNRYNRSEKAKLAQRRYNAISRDKEHSYWVRKSRLRYLKLLEEKI